MGSSEEGGPQLERQELWSQLQNAMAARSHEDTLLWSIFGIFWAANAVLLVAIFRNGTMPSERAVPMVVAAVGLLMSTSWHLMQRRTLAHIRRYEALIERIEQRLKIDGSLAISGHLNIGDYDKYLAAGPRVRTVVLVCSGVAILAWAAGLVAAGIV